MRRSLWTYFIVIIALAVVGVFIILPKSPLGGNKIKAQLGLDLVGGTELIYQADLSQSQNKSVDMTNLQNVLRSRVDQLGVAEPSIQTSGADRIIIELPGIKDINSAIDKIGQTYELVFYTEADTSDPSGVTLTDYYEDYTYPGLWKLSDLTGRNLVASKTSATFQNASSSVQSDPVVSLVFDNAGRDKFAQLTKDNLNKRIAIVLDNKVVSAPTVQTQITDGNAVITGMKDITEAQKLASRLKEGALPVTAKLVAQQNIGASLGQDSLKMSMVAGLIGILALVIFMIVYYRIPGVLAVFALIVYGIISMSLFKLIPVTLTLAGIAGFILSVGMAVDANVLIFERTKEEIRSGKEKVQAIKDGFSRAWPSIRDSNFSSLITCLILYLLGSGPVKGFALTLAIGVAVSMFTAITVTRTFIMLLAGTKFSRFINV